MQYDCKFPLALVVQYDCKFPLALVVQYDCKVLIGKGGVLDQLDSASAFPQGTDEGFTKELLNNSKNGEFSTRLECVFHLLRSFRECF